MNKQEYFDAGLEILTKLNNSTYEAYIVGGFVRSYLMNVDYNDIDICTSASPDEVIALFENTNASFKNLGVVGVKYKGFSFDVATFKTETYSAPKIIKDITYSKKMADDIYRRDFTINAIHMTRSKKIVDLLGGVDDINKKIIRVIGDGQERFSEDPVRILRGFNLVASLGFSFVESTYQAVKKCKGLLSDLSTNIYSKFFLDVFNSPYGKKAMKSMYTAGIHECIKGYTTGFKKILKNYDKLDTLGKFACFYKLNGGIPENSCFNSKQTEYLEKVLMLASILEESPIDKLQVYTYTKELCLISNQVNKVTCKKYKDQSSKIIKLSNSITIHKTCDLLFKGQDILLLTNGKTGPFITDIVETLKYKVITGELSNNYEVLKKEAVSLLSKYNITSSNSNIHLAEPISSESKFSSLNQGADYIQKPELDDATLQLLNNFNLDLKTAIEYNISQNSQKMSPSSDDFQVQAAIIKQKVTRLLLEQKPEYKILKEKELI